MRNRDVHQEARAARAERTADQWVEALGSLKAAGQWFLLQDAAQVALEKFPEDPRLIHLRGLALVNVGAYKEALDLVEDVTKHTVSRPADLQAAYGQVRALFKSITGNPFEDKADNEALDTLSELADILDRLQHPAIADGKALEELLALRGRIHKELWQRTQEQAELQLSHDCYSFAYRLTKSAYPGINAASTSLLLGNIARAHDLAREVLGKRMQEREPDFWLHATAGEAALLLGNQAQAVSDYGKALETKHDNQMVESARRQIRLLEKHGLTIPEQVLQWFADPRVIIFAGHMIDAPDRSEERFPAWLEEEVRHAISEQLEQVDASIGYSSAACGADLLFIEAMFARGAEVNIVLPFSAHDFKKASLAFAGHNWVTRFESACELADSVSYITDQSYLGDDSLFDICNRIVLGKGVFRARQLLSQATMMTALDSTSVAKVGGTASIYQLWPDAGQRSFIDIAELRNNATRPATVPELTPPPGRSHADKDDGSSDAINGLKREIRAIMFADLKDFSKLRDDDGKSFIRYFKTIHRHVADNAPNPRLVRTAGDGFFVVMQSATDLAEYAVALKDGVARANAKITAMRPLKVRIALHAAPVYEFENPFTNGIDYYGSDVNRTARLEPVTVPDRIYATEQFIALFISEAIGAQDDLDGVFNRWAAEYVGEVSAGQGLRRATGLSRLGTAGRPAGTDHRGIASCFLTLTTRVSW